MLFGEKVCFLLLSLSVGLAGCAKQAWYSVGPAAREIPQADARVDDPFAKAAETLLTRMLESEFLQVEAIEQSPVPITIHRVEMLDLAPPTNLPTEQGVWTHLIEGIEASDRVELVRASVVLDSPVLLSDAPFSFTLNYEVFRLADVPRVPDRAFYLARLWVFDVLSRETRWEAIADPIAWPINPPVPD
ncbi:MAG: hypothetical protein AAGJ38_09510 [Planctomycetota bacterium]